MRTASQISILSIIILSGCIDQLEYQIPLPQELPISVSGHITNQPGPYEVTINRGFDIQSLEDRKIPITAQRVILFDELGNNEELKEVSSGIYQTDPAGIQGKVGGIYWLRIELFDGRIYESKPDTILPPGEIETLYYEFNSKKDLQGNEQSGFDIKVNSHENSIAGKRYMWSIVNTFKATTYPELATINTLQCYPIVDDPIQNCNFLPLCTGLRNTSPPFSIPEYKRIAPCECCTCWYQLFNSAPILSDDLFTAKGIYNALNIYRLPLNEWIFMFKTHTVVTQSTLTLNTFRYFKSIKEQKNALGSLFQPITGKIPNTFIQINGTSSAITGIFYAAGTNVKNTFITRDDVPNQSIIPSVRFDLGIGLISCLELFPNATNIKPDFWVD